MNKYRFRGRKCLREGRSWFEKNGDLVIVWEEIFMVSKVTSRVIWRFCCWLEVSLKDYEKARDILVLFRCWKKEGKLKTKRNRRELVVSANETSRIDPLFNQDRSLLQDKQGSIPLTTRIDVPSTEAKSSTKKPDIVFLINF